MLKLLPIDFLVEKLLGTLNMMRDYQQKYM